MAYRNYATANSRIIDPAGNGDFTTIAAALTASSSGMTLFLRPGTYTENPTLKAGVNLCAFDCDAQNNVIINGTCTLSAAGTVSISGIQLQTNSAPALTVSGSAASKVILNNCYINALNNTAISYSSSSASSSITCNNCVGNIGTTSIALYTMSSTGGLFFNYCYLNNTGISTTASSNSSGVVYFTYSVMTGACSTSSTGIISSSYCIFNIGGVSNTTAITTAGTGITGLTNCQVFTGSASAISIGSGTTVFLYNVIVTSTATNAITGAGTCNFTGIQYAQGSTYLNNTTTQAGGTIQGIRAGNAPSAGYLGEQIRSFVATGSAISLSTSTAANITSINLTAGVWDISCNVKFVPASTTSVTALQWGISPSTAAIDILGDDCGAVAYTTAVVGQGYANTIPSYRVTLSSTTTYYLVALATFTVSTVTAYGRISATRVG
jgi:hypothetical protein